MESSSGEVSVGRERHEGRSNPKRHFKPQPFPSLCNISQNSDLNVSVTSDLRRRRLHRNTNTSDIVSRVVLWSVLVELFGRPPPATRSPPRSPFSLPPPARIKRLEMIGFIDRPAVRLSGRLSECRAAPLLSGPHCPPPPCENPALI